MNLAFWLPAMFVLGVVAIGIVLSVSDRLRENLRRGLMIYLTAAIAALLFIYLFVAMVRPEWF